MQLIKQGEQVFQSQPKVPADLLILTYGAFVAKILSETDDNDPKAVNQQLEQIGWNIGSRMIDEFFARLPTSQQQPCREFRQSLEILTKTAMKMFLNTTCDYRMIEGKKNEVYLTFRDNPLAEYVILPPKIERELWYSNVLCGIIRGAFEQISVTVKAEFINDVLRGHESTVILV